MIGVSNNRLASRDKGWIAVITQSSTQTIRNARLWFLSLWCYVVSLNVINNSTGYSPMRVRDNISTISSNQMVVFR